MSRYETYKPSGIDWIGEVPKHWEVKRLKNIVSTDIGGLWGDEAAEDENDIIVLRVADFDRTNSRIIDNPDFTYRNIKASQLDGRLIKQGDILLEKSGGGEQQPVGKAVLFDKDIRAVTSNFINKIETIPSVNNHFALYLFEALYFNNINVRNIKQTTGIQNLDNTGYFGEKISLPPATEQHNIANYLDDQTQKIDRLIANKKAQAEKLKELRQIEINKAVTKGLNPNAEMKESGIEWLGKIPKHWEVKKVKQLLKSEKNAIKTGPFGSDLKFEDLVEQGIKVYNQRSVLDNDWVSGEGYITQEKYKSLETCTIYPGDIVITTRGTIGKASIFPENAELGILHPCLMRVQMNNYRVLNDFLKIIINESGYFLEALKLASNATTIDVVYSDNLKEVKIAVPPTTEQKEIIAFVVKRTEAIDQLIKNIEAQIEKLQELRKIKIYEAVTGKIKVNAYAETTA